jgi:hypothetical protein
VLESKYTTLLIRSEHKLFLNPSLCLTYTTTHCYIHLVGRVNFLLVFEEIILPRERERELCVVSCSLEAFWFCYSVLKSPRKNTAKKEAKKARRQHRRGFVCVFFSFVRWCFVITLVSRLASLAQTSLGPTYYRH